MNIRVGQGVDVHAFSEGRPLVLGGIQVPFHLGLAGHSDADVLIHAICDALLGALALGDIGHHFPDTDPELENIDSCCLLEHVVHLLGERHWYVGNVDATLIAQRPKLAPHISAMREKLAGVMQIAVEDVSIKATTTEQLGFTGRGEGIAAQAVVLLQQHV